MLSGTPRQEEDPKRHYYTSVAIALFICVAGRSRTRDGGLLNIAIGAVPCRYLSPCRSGHTVPGAVSGFEIRVMLKGRVQCRGVVTARSRRVLRVCTNVGIEHVRSACSARTAHRRQQPSACGCRMRLRIMRAAMRRSARVRRLGYGPDSSDQGCLISLGGIPFSVDTSFCSWRQVRLYPSADAWRRNGGY